MRFITLLLALFLNIVGSNALYAKTEIKFSFRNMVDNKPLVLNDSTYVNAAGNTFTLSMCKYYISNLSFKDESGKAIDIANSYHLVNQSKPSSKSFTVNTLPGGKYVAVRFMIGVDSLHNVSGAQDGELDPINAMFWDWNTGYIMAKIEGTSSAAPDNAIEFHLGGFSGATSVLHWVTLQFPQPLVVSGEKTSVINIDANIAEWFKTPMQVDFSKIAVVTTESKEAAAIADNYADMFTLQSITQ